MNYNQNRRRGNGNNYDNNCRAAQKTDAVLLQLELRAKLKELCVQSTSFATYIETIGGIKQMEQDIVNEDINAICKWLPFAYA